MSQDGYVGVRLPQDLIEQIDRIIADSKMGFRTRAEFVKEAVRRYILQLELYGEKRKLL